MIFFFLSLPSPLWTPVQRHRPCAQDPRFKAKERSGSIQSEQPDLRLNAILLDGPFLTYPFADVPDFPVSLLTIFSQFVRAQLHDDAWTSRWRVNSQTEHCTVEGEWKAKWGRQDEDPWDLSFFVLHRRHRWAEFGPSASIQYPVDGAANVSQEHELTEVVGRCHPSCLRYQVLLFMFLLFEFGGILTICNCIEMIIPVNSVISPNKTFFSFLFFSSKYYNTNQELEYGQEQILQGSDTDHRLGQWLCSMELNIRAGWPHSFPDWEGDADD